MLCDFFCEVFFSLFEAVALHHTDEAVCLNLGAKLLSNAVDIAGNRALEQIGTNEVLLKQANLLDLLCKSALYKTDENLVFANLCLVRNCNLCKDCISLLGNEVNKVR